MKLTFRPRYWVWRSVVKIPQSDFKMSNSGLYLDWLVCRIWYLVKEDSPIEVWSILHRERWENLSLSESLTILIWPWKSLRVGTDQMILAASKTNPLVNTVILYKIVEYIRRSVYLINIFTNYGKLKLVADYSNSWGTVFSVIFSGVRIRLLMFEAHLSYFI